MSVILNARHARAERVDIAPAHHAGLAGLRAWRVDNRVGESPTWDVATQTLLWIDVRAPALLRLDPRTDALTRWDLPEVVGALGLAAGERVVLALRRHLAVLELPTGRLETLLEVVGEPEGNRLNDGKVSPCGRWFVFGSMDDAPAGKRATGRLYCAGVDGSLRTLHDGLTVANGIAWSADGNALFFSDSHAGRVWQAIWHATTGTIGPSQPFCESHEATGRPDGAAVDEAGMYWSAGVSAGCLNAFDGSGRRVRRLPVPCRWPTMPCFGGSDLGALFVTSLVRPGLALHPSGLDGALMSFHADARGSAPGRWQFSVGPDANRCQPQVLAD